MPTQVNTRAIVSGSCVLRINKDDCHAGCDTSGPCSCDQSYYRNCPNVICAPVVITPLVQLYVNPAPLPPPVPPITP